MQKSRKNECKAMAISLGEIRDVFENMKLFISDEAFHSEAFKREYITIMEEILYGLEQVTIMEHSRQ